MCGEREESTTHLIAQCKMLAQKENTQRCDNTDGNCTFKVMPEILAGWGD